MKFKWII